MSVSGGGAPEAHLEDERALAALRPSARSDPYWWLFGVAAPAFTAVSMWWAPPLEASFGVGGLAIFGAYFLRMPWARAGLFALPVAGVGLSIPHGQDVIEPAVAAAAIGTGVAWMAWRSPRNRSTFGLEVEADVAQRPS